MFSIITVFFSLFFISLIGWSITTYFIKKNSQKIIIKELKNLFDIGKMFFVSLKRLIGILKENSFSSDFIQTNPTESNELDQHPLSLVEPVKEIEAQSLKIPLEDDDDAALASFSPEVVEVINEEEEKVA